ncbi:MAG: 1-acyl-sn-glycerol-3-phosphate acyltransferase [Panacibacter sp.]
MFRAFCVFMFRITGWTVDMRTPPEIKRCIIIAAPHTSNWDFWYTMASFSILRLKIRYTIKKEWMRFPFSMITKPLGGIAIDRSAPEANETRMSHTDAMIDLYKHEQELIVIITPEGTRSKREQWKTGFYHIAKGASVPICLGYVDYKEKKAGIAKTIYPSEMQKDMKEIMSFYKTIHAKFPGKFSVDINYV